MQTLLCSVREPLVHAYAQLYIPLQQRRKFQQQFRVIVWVHAPMGKKKGDQTICSQ